MKVEKKVDSNKWIKTAQFFALFGITLVGLAIVFMPWPIEIRTFALGAYSLILAGGFVMASDRQ